MNSFFEGIGLTDFKPNQSFMTRRSRRKLARKLKESAPQGFEAGQTDISEFTFAENLKAKIQANKTSKKDELKSLKAKALAKITDKSENSNNFINEYSSLPKKERRLALRNELQARAEGNERLEELKDKFSDKIIPFKKTKPHPETRGEIRASIKDAINAKREDAKTFISELSSLPEDERLPALRNKLSNRIQGTDSNLFITALSGNNGLFSGIDPQISAEAF